MKTNLTHPEMKKDETLAAFHGRCAQYHEKRRTALVEAQNYRDSAHHGDLADLHRHAAEFLAAPSPQREMNQDERDDTILGR